MCCGQNNVFGNQTSSTIYNHSSIVSVIYTPNQSKVRVERNVDIRTTINPLLGAYFADVATDTKDEEGYGICEESHPSALLFL
mmetsp:Transcript_23317/g.35323  ORF Transcript_23317/g.35323 Transcript_23317/m.35323 type:complete len:83 (-) Transcript_23317:159-407(-)